MNIYLGTETQGALKEARKSLMVQWPELLHILESRSRAREASWGEAGLFFEVSTPIPRGSSHNQFDLLLAFADHRGRLRLLISD